MPVFSNFEKCRPEVADDVVSGVAVEKIGMDVHVKFGASMLNSSRIIGLLPASPVLLTFVQYLIAFCSRPEETM